MTPFQSFLMFRFLNNFFYAFLTQLRRKPIFKKRSERSVSDSSTNDSAKFAKQPKKPQVARKKKIVKAIPLDGTGKPIFPIVLGDFTVHSLGEVSLAEFMTGDISNFKKGLVFEVSHSKAT